MPGCSTRPDRPPIRRTAGLARRLAGCNSLTGHRSARQVLPVNGSREALFAFTQTVVDLERGMPWSCADPFYQIYEGRYPGRARGLRRATRPGGFALRLLGARDPGRDTQLLFVCSPGNPTGAVMPLAGGARCSRWPTGTASWSPPTSVTRDLFRRRAALGGLEAARAVWAATTMAPGVLQPVQAQQRARHALGFRGRRPRHPDEPSCSTAPTTAAR